MCERGRERERGKQIPSLPHSLLSHDVCYIPPSLPSFSQPTVIQGQYMEKKKENKKLSHTHAIAIAHTHTHTHTRNCTHTHARRLGIFCARTGVIYALRARNFLYVTMQRGLKKGRVFSLSLCLSFFPLSLFFPTFLPHISFSLTNALVGCSFEAIVRSHSLLLSLV